MGKQFSVAKTLTAEEVFSTYKCYKETIAVYVPSTIYDIPVDNTEHVNSVLKQMAELFGGSSAYEVMGGYVANSGEYISEKVKVVKSFAEQVTGELALKVLDIAKQLKESMQQESIAIEYNGQMMFV